MAIDEERITNLEDQVRALTAALSTAQSDLQHAQGDLNGLRTTVSLAAPIGSITAYVGSDVPDGWLPCDGRALPNDGEYKPLFDVIQRTHGDGSSGNGAPGDFNLPDLRGYFLRGADPDGNIDPNISDRTPPPGATSGTGIGSRQSDSYARHNHSGSEGTTKAVIWGSGSTPGSNGDGQAAYVFQTNYIDGGSTYWGEVVNAPDAPASSGQGNETRPKNVAVSFIIKF